MINRSGELPLRGGRVTPGVVRLGDTVRRPRTANSEFVRRLLRHLAANGFEGAARSLGADERGREIFSYIEGDVPPDLAFHDDATLSSAAKLIRRFHDLTAELIAAPADAGIEVVCHNDLSPCNFVFHTGVPIALIDFDAAAPGARTHDLGYAAWLWLDLGSPEIPATEQQRRLGLFLKAYGTDDRASVVTAMLRRQAMLADEGRRLGDTAKAAWASDCLAWTRQNEKLLCGI